MAQIGTDLDAASHILLAGGLVAIPTETVYGLAANALNEQAVLKIFEAKQRPFFDPLIVHVHSREAVSTCAYLLDEKLITLAARFWPGPLTLLLPKKLGISDLVTSGLPRVAVRIPNHPLTLRLLEMTGLPLAAPSANPFGYISPTSPAHVQKQLGGKIGYILDGGPSGIGIESTIVGIEDGRVCIYRLGGLPIEDIERVIGRTEKMINQSSDPKAPGQLKNHYAPAKPMLVGNIKQLIQSNPSKRVSVICFGNQAYEAASVYNLSPGRNLAEAALNLFKFLRLADEDNSNLVVAEYLPECGLGLAINDRLKRASL